MNSTRPTTFVDPEFTQVVRSAAGIGLCVAGLVIVALSMQRASERLTLLEGAALLEEAVATGQPMDRERLLARSADVLSGVMKRNRADPAAPAALARVRIAQATLPGADQAGLLADADKQAQASVARGGALAEVAALRADIAMQTQTIEGQNSAPALIAASYGARPVDARLGLVRARLGLRLWGDLDERERTAVKAETCLVLRDAPSLLDTLQAAALAAEAPLLPTDFAEWAADPGCQPAT